MPTARARNSQALPAYDDPCCRVTLRGRHGIRLAGTVRAFEVSGDPQSVVASRGAPANLGAAVGPRSKHKEPHRSCIYYRVQVMPLSPPIRSWVSSVPVRWEAVSYT